MHERRLLLFSIAATTALGLFGIVVGIAIGSQAILYDGIYGLSGTLMGWLMLKVSSLAEEGPTRRYPFGREAVTPLFVAISGLLTLATLLYAVAESVFTISRGGSEPSAGWAIAYAVSVTLGCMAVWLWLRSAAGHSDLLKLESVSWRIAAFGGLWMVGGFGALLLIQGSRWDGVAPYIDPAMVLLGSVVFLSTPFGMIRSGYVELIEGAPPEEIAEAVRHAVASVSATYELGEPDVRATKVGPKVYVEVTGEAGPNVTITEEHEVRRELKALLDAMPYDVWLNFELLPREAAG